MTRKQVFGLCFSAVAVLAVTAAACSSPATQPAQPAAPATAAAPAKKINYPENGKAITIIVPFAAGGSTDIGARLLATGMEKALGVPVQVENKGGAGSQTGLTEIARAKPDGYTLGFANLPTANLVYTDPERKAVFSAKDFQPIGVQVVDPSAIGVKADGPYKTLKDLIDASKAQPEKVKFGSDGPMTDDALGIFQLEKATGAKFANVGFDGSAPNLAAVMGNHIDGSFGHVGDFVGPSKAGQIRVLAVADTQRSPFFPDVPTLQEAGYNIVNSSTRTLVAPAGVSKEIVDILSAAMKKAMDEPEHKQKMQDSGLTLRYMDPAQAAAVWAQMDILAKQLVDASRTN
jgi:tripartite-type tricarboxylate transporter receptor subunit TctC